MKIWIDLSTAPDPLFFRPIVDRLHALGHTTWLTARQYSETEAIARQVGFDFMVVGRHGGRTVVGKAAAILGRAWQLARLARRQKVDVAVSFNSYAQGLAARLCGIPFITIMDYEHQPANHLAFRLARRVIVPRGFEREALRQQGARPRKVLFFDGLKEHITLAYFEPDIGFRGVLESLGIKPEDTLVTLRPPATWSTYHRFENEFFDYVALWLARQPNINILLLPRYSSQAEHFRSLGLSNLVIPEAVLDGLNLVYWSDLVVSAGGSMNREAVVLQTPAWTVFRGKMAGIDHQLIQAGTLKHIESLQDLEGVKLSKKTLSPLENLGSRALEQVISGILRR